MIRLTEVAEAFVPDLEACFSDQLLPGHRNALSAILRCRTEACGTAAVHCHDCEQDDSFPLSCGHRFYPQCQNEAVEQWLRRQRAKLLPVDYYPVAFTVPVQMRPLVYIPSARGLRSSHQACLGDPLRVRIERQDVARSVGATAVLHTHSRAVNFHPHVHIVVPAAAIDTVHKRLRTKQGKFLFPEKALAKVFRGKWFQAMKDRGSTVKANLPHKWIVDCEWVATGEKR